MFGAGLFADQIGLRAALLIGSVARVVSLVMLAFAGNLWSLLVAITVFGLSGSVLAPAPTSRRRARWRRRTGSTGCSRAWSRPRR